jgi:hypothetical protein
MDFLSASLCFCEDLSLQTTKVVSSNPAHGEVYSTQHCVIKLASDLRQVGGFLWVPGFPTSIVQVTATI